MPAHKHAELMMEYAKDAAASDAPERKWEYKSDTGGGWVKCLPGEAPAWIESFSYRRQIVPFEAWAVFDSQGEWLSTFDDADAAAAYAVVGRRRVAHLNEVV